LEVSVKGYANVEGVESDGEGDEGDGEVGEDGEEGDGEMEVDGDENAWLDTAISELSDETQPSAKDNTSAAGDSASNPTMLTDEQHHLIAESAAALTETVGMSLRAIDRAHPPKAKKQKKKPTSNYRPTTNPDFNPQTPRGQMIPNPPPTPRAPRRARDRRLTHVRRMSPTPPRVGQIGPRIRPSQQTSTNLRAVTTTPTADDGEDTQEVPVRFRRGSTQYDIGGRSTQFGSSGLPSTALYSLAEAAAADWQQVQPFSPLAQVLENRRRVEGDFSAFPSRSPAGTDPPAVSDQTAGPDSEETSGDENLAQLAQEGSEVEEWMREGDKMFGYDDEERYLAGAEGMIVEGEEEEEEEVRDEILRLY